MNILYKPAGGKVEINDGYFESEREVIYSHNKEIPNPPEVVINGGTFVSGSAVWGSPD